MKNLFKITAFIALTLLLKVNVLAQTAADVLPCDQYNTSVFDACGDVNSQVTNLIKALLAFIFIAIMLYGVFLIIKAAVTIIRSNGDPSQIEAGVGMMRGVYIGIGIIFVGLIGLIIVLAFFGAGGILNVTLNAPEGTQIPLITN
ncbi:hypothetical protein DOJK_01712 [Patescibacteria group bacterium]|mgnify:CR=1 FL=1|jgi:hypothetical protein|nr:hypothetical protein [Candidatus Dojkabacteria bacterium]CAG1022498.1 hypothetical protein DOJK_01712 [Patescibacteria group bacterium]